MAEQLFKRNDIVRNSRTEYRVLEAHEDGSLDLEATWSLNPDGSHAPIYLGYIYKGVPDHDEGGKTLELVSRQGEANREWPVSTDDAVALEEIVDRYGVKAVIESLASIAALKVDHVMQVWGDKPLARDWSTIATYLDKVSETRTIRRDPLERV